MKKDLIRGKCQGIDGCRSGGEESEREYQTNSPDKNVDIDGKKAFNSSKPKDLSPLEQSDKGTIFKEEHPHCQGQAQILSADCSQSDSIDLHSQLEDEHDVEHNIQQIDENGKNHRISSILHAQKPTLKNIQAECGRCCIDADIKILRGQSLNSFITLEEAKTDPGDPRLKSEDEDASAQRKQQAASQNS